MKTRKTILCGIFAVIFALFLATCGDDDQVGNNKNNNNNNNNNGDPYVPEEVIDSGTYGDFEYDYGATTVTITGYTGSGGAVTIPSTIEGKPVVAIGYRAFSIKQLTSVVILNSVISIGEQAFSENPLTSLTIGSSVTTIGDGAFAYNQLTSVTVAPGNTSFITKNSFLLSKDEKTLILFYGTAKTVNIPNSVTTIGPGAFAGNALTSVTIPNSVTTIGYHAFAWNDLTSVTIPDSVTTIGDSAFRNNQLISVTIGPNVTLGEWDAYDREDHYSVSFPDDFAKVYNDGGKQAGTYTREDADGESSWTKL